MKKLLILLIIFGFTLYLKPEFKFPDGSNSLKLKDKFSQSSLEPFNAGQAGRLVKVIGENGKVYYIPISNILTIIED